MQMLTRGRSERGNQTRAWRQSSGFEDVNVEVKRGLATGKLDVVQVVRALTWTCSSRVK